MIFVLFGFVLIAVSGLTLMALGLHYLFSSDLSLLVKLAIVSILGFVIGLLLIPFGIAESEGYQ